MKLPVVFHPNDAMLRKKTTEVSLEALKNETTQKLINDMIDTMHASRGIGIAAPQVNASVRICIVNKEAFDKKCKINGKAVEEDVVLINPTFERTSKKKDTDTEMCLSIPGITGRVTRPRHIEVTALDRHGNEMVFAAKGYYPARVIQHEIDHLDGVLFIDRTDDVWEVEAH